MPHDIQNYAEEEMEREAIDHFLRQLEENDVLQEWKNILESGSISIQAFVDTLSGQLNNYWDVDMYRESNCEYLRDQLGERMKEIGFDLAKDVR